MKYLLIILLFTLGFEAHASLTWNTTGSGGTWTTTPDSYIRTDVAGPNYAFIQSNEEVTSGDITLEFTPTQAGGANENLFGLDVTPFAAGDSSFGSLQFSFYFNSGNASRYENGIGSAPMTTYSLGDKFKIEVDSGSGGTVTYWKDAGAGWVLLHTSANTLTTYPVRVTGNAHYQNAGISDIKFNSFGTPAPPAAGTFIPFPPVNPPVDSISAKGNLLTSNGTNQVEFPACSDTEIIEWDADETFGFKCVAKPVDTNTNAATLCTDGQYLDGDGACKTAGGSSNFATDEATGGSAFHQTAVSSTDTFSQGLIPNLGVAITASGTNPILVNVGAYIRLVSTSTTTGSKRCGVEILRNAASIGDLALIDDTSDNPAGGTYDSMGLPVFIDTNVADGVTYTYTFNAYSQNGKCQIQGSVPSGNIIAVARQL